MDKLGYTWDPHTVPTDDGYFLTLFHITGKTDTGPFTPTKPPVLFNHGNYQDAASWLSDSSNYSEEDDGSVDVVPYHLQLADSGYDVWLGNNRGTWYSQGHVEYDAVEDDEFWMYTWGDMGLYDDTANITRIKQETGYDKVFYVGYSQGTIQMFYALSHLQDWMAENLLKVVQLAPCFVSGRAPIPPESARETVFQYQSLGVYAYSGPHWERDRAILIENFPALTPFYMSFKDDDQPAAI